MGENPGISCVEYNAAFNQIVFQGLKLDHSSAGELGDSLQESTPWIKDAWADNDYLDQVVVRIGTTEQFTQMPLEERSSHFIEAIDHSLNHLGTTRSQVPVSFTKKPTPRNYF